MINSITLLLTAKFRFYCEAGCVREFTVPNNINAIFYYLERYINKGRLINLPICRTAYFKTFILLQPHKNQKLIALCLLQ